MKRTDPRPNLAALAQGPGAATFEGIVRRANPLQHDSQDRLRLLHDERDYIHDLWTSGEIDKHEWRRRYELLDDAAKRIGAEAPAPADCPAWCTSHRFHTTLLDEVEGESEHRWIRPSGDSAVEVSQWNSQDPVVILPQCDEYTLEEARELAALILAACDAVEAKAAS